MEECNPDDKDVCKEGTQQYHPSLYQNHTQSTLVRLLCIMHLFQKRRNSAAVG